MYTFEPIKGKAAGLLTLEVPLPTGADLVRTFTASSRTAEHLAKAYICPGCQQPGLDRTGLPDLAFVFDTCECGDPDYPHLIEQLWHRNCLMGVSR